MIERDSSTLPLLASHTSHPSNWSCNNPHFVRSCWILASSVEAAGSSNSAVSATIERRTLKRQNFQKVSLHFAKLLILILTVTLWSFFFLLFPSTSSGTCEEGTLRIRRKRSVRSKPRHPPREAASGAGSLCTTIIRG